MKLLFFSCLFFISINGLYAQPAEYIHTNEAKSDIEQMVATFENVHYNPYFKTTKEEFDLEKNDLLNNWDTDSISYKLFMATGMKLAAIMSGGHSYMYWQNAHIVPELKAHLYIPFTGKLVDNHQTFIVTRSAIAEVEPGMEIRSINGIALDDLFEECMMYTGGVDAFKIATIEKLFPLYLFFNENLKAPFSIEVYNLDENISTKGLDIGGLTDFVNSAQTGVDYSFEILDAEIGLITYNSCQNYKKFDKFLKETFKTIKRENIDKLIIDIRENGGGDSGLNDLLLTYITKSPYQQASGRYWKVSEEAKKAYSENKAYIQALGEEFFEKYMKTPNQTVIEEIDSTALTYPVAAKNYYEGKSCMLIGPSTFSSANFLADAVKTYKLTTLIGAPTGEYTNDFGEQLSFTLENSGSIVYISSTYDIGANGNDSILEVVYPDIETEFDALQYAISWIQKDDLKE